MPWLPPGDLPDLGIKPMSLRSPALAGRFFMLAPAGKTTTDSKTAWDVAENADSSVHATDQSIYNLQSRTGEDLC